MKVNRNPFATVSSVVVAAYTLVGPLVKYLYTVRSIGVIQFILMSCAHAYRCMCLYVVLLSNDAMFGWPFVTVPQADREMHGGFWKALRVQLIIGAI